MKNNTFLVLSGILILTVASVAGYFYRKSCALELRQHENMLLELEFSAMDHFRGLDKEAASNSRELMGHLKEYPPDTAKIHRKIDEIAEIQKHLQIAVIDTVIQKMAQMAPAERRKYLENFNKWLNTFRSEVR